MKNTWLRNLYLKRQQWLLLAIVALTVLSIIGFQRFSFDNEARALFRTNDTTFEQLEEIFEQFRPDENDCLVVLKCPEDTFFSDHAVSQLQHLTNTLEKDSLVSHVVSVFSPEMLVCDPLPRPLVPPADTKGVDWRQVEQQVLTHPIAGGNLITPDAKAMLLVIQLGNDDLLVSDYQPTVSHLQQVIKTWREKSGIQAYLTGLPPVRVEIFRSIKTDTFNLMLAGACVAVFIAFIAFRNWALAFMAVAGAGIGSFWALGLLSLSGVKINLITTILPVLVVVIGLTDAVHLVFDFRESRVRGIKPYRAGWLAVRRLGVACAFTSVTTAIGFGSLSVSSIEVIQQFGITCAVGTLITFLAVLLVVPWLASTRLIGGAYQGEISRDSVWLKKFSGHYADFLLKHRYAVLAMFCVLLTWITMTTLRLHPDSHIAESIPKGSEAEVALREVDRQFGGMLSSIVLVQWDATNPQLEDPLNVLRSVDKDRSGSLDNEDFEKGLRQHKRMKHGLSQPFRGDSNSQTTPEKTRRSRSSASLPASPIVKTNRGDSCQDCENDDCAIHCCDIHKCGGCEMVFSDHNDMGDHMAKAHPFMCHICHLDCVDYNGRFKHHFFCHNVTRVPKYP